MALKLKAVRANLGLNQEEFAQKIGVTKDSVSNYEKGKSLPNKKVIDKILELSGMKYEDIEF